MLTKSNLKISAVYGDFEVSPANNIYNYWKLHLLNE